MKFLTMLLAALALAFSNTACEDRDRQIDETTDGTPPAVREEGPAERTGRIVDEATREAAEAVSKGLEKAGKEVREHVPPSDDPDAPPPAHEPE